MSAPDTQLRANVRLLGDVLGEVLVEQEGEELLALEEQIRGLARVARETGDRAELEETIGALELERQSAVLRAFSLFFQLANIAEQHHRLRRQAPVRARGAGAAGVARRRGGAPARRRRRRRGAARGRLAAPGPSRSDRAPDRGHAPHDPPGAPAARNRAAPARRSGAAALDAASRPGSDRRGGDDAVADGRGALAPPARRRRDPPRPLVRRAEPVAGAAATRPRAAGRDPGRAAPTPARHLDRR